MWAGHYVLQGMRGTNQNSVATSAAGFCGYNTLTKAATTLTPNSFNLQNKMEKSNPSVFSFQEKNYGNVLIKRTNLSHCRFGPDYSSQGEDQKWVLGRIEIVWPVITKYVVGLLEGTIDIMIIIYQSLNLMLAFPKCLTRI